MISTTLANGEAALDMTWYKDNPASQPVLHPIYQFDNIKKSHSFRSYEEALASYTSYYGYIVRQNTKRASIIASRVGHSDYYDVYVANDWVMLVYKKKGGSNTIYVQDGAKMNFDFIELTPMRYLASSMARVLGTPATSYLINSGNLYEIFESSGIGMLDADYQIYSGMSLVAAFGLRAGSLGLKYWPYSNKAALNLLTNKDLGKATFVDLPGKYGVYFTTTKRSSAEKVISDIQNGVKLGDLSWCKVYPAPESKARSTAAIPSFVCRFDGSKPVKELGTGEQIDVVLGDVLFDTEVPGEGIREWINGAPVWETATYYITEMADVAGIITDYKTFMRDKYAHAASQMSGAFNTAIKKIDTALNAVARDSRKNFELDRAALKHLLFDSINGAEPRISVDQNDRDYVIGTLTDKLRVKFDVPVASIFPCIGELAEITDINKLQSQLQQTAPGLLNYGDLLSVIITKKDGSKVTKLLDSIEDADVQGVEDIQFEVTDASIEALTAYLVGEGSETVAGKAYKHCLDSLALLLKRNFFDIEPGAVQQVRGDQSGWVDRTHEYGCNKSMRVWRGAWIGSANHSSGQPVSEADVSYARDLTGGAASSLYNNFPVNHSADYNLLYYKTLKENGFSEDAISGQTWRKAFDFAIKEVAITGFFYERAPGSENKYDRVLNPDMKFRVQIDDFSIEQEAASLKKDPAPDIIEARWKAAAEGGDAKATGSGRFQIKSETRSIKVNQWCWGYSDFSGIPVGGNSGERVVPSRLVEVIVGDSLADLSGLSQHFAVDHPENLIKIGAGLSNKIVAEGLCYLLRRLSELGDLKNCKTLVSTASSYLTTAMAKYFTVLSIDEAGAQVIKDCVAELLNANVPNSDGSEGGRVITDPDTRAGLQQIADDFLQLQLKASEDKPWFASSDDIKVNRGITNLDALGLYLYL